MRAGVESLRAESRRVGADFVEADLRLGLTFARLAATGGMFDDPGGAGQALRNARRAYDTALTLRPLVEGRAAIDDKLRELGRLLGAPAATGARDTP
jgi:hypothetical protein